ncbi:protein of unknown function (plasmid) [Azospirillum baldaniorum]|uniref:Uncharacterized protein n=1 Tax=Azospirillum baldaniorum TaxID=1064539 RepID=A0A9P1JZ73_9PROT|nr:protein of unknown function [Azospirillum baldaniorum]
MAPPTVTVTVAPASAVPLRVGVVLLLSAVVTVGAFGAPLSMVTLRVLEADDVPWHPSTRRSGKKPHRPTRPS